jgi:hypothetical protein
VDATDLTNGGTDPDRSVNGNGLAVYGTVTKAAVATGAELMSYSGFSTANYLEQPYNADLDFGTGDFSITGWVSGSGQQTVIHRAQPAAGGGFMVEVASTGALYVYLNPNTTWGLRLSTGTVPADTWSLITVTRASGVLSSYINGELAATDGGSNSAISFPNNGDEPTRVGIRQNDAWPADSLVLIRISATAPSAAQIAKIYEDEKHLFTDNALAVLSADAVTALSHDPITDLLYVSGASGTATVAGITPVSRDATAVSTFISVVDGLEIKQ